MQRAGDVAQNRLDRGEIHQQAVVVQPVALQGHLDPPIVPMKRLEGTVPQAQPMGRGKLADEIDFISFRHQAIPVPPFPNPAIVRKVSSMACLVNDSLGMRFRPTTAAGGGRAPSAGLRDRYRLALAALWGIPLLLSTACHEAPRHVTDVLPADGEDLPILFQRQGTHSNETQALQVVVRDPSTLAQIPLEDVPVDFATEMLLIVTLGRVTSDQYGVEIERVWRDGGLLRVQTLIRTPQLGAPVRPASPYCIAVVPRCPLNVEGFLPAPPPRERSWEQSTPPTQW